MEMADNSAVFPLLHIFLVATCLALAWQQLKVHNNFLQLGKSQSKIRIWYGPRVLAAFGQCTSSSKYFVGNSNSDFSWCNRVQILFLTFWSPWEGSSITKTNCIFVENLTWMPAILVTTSKWHTKDSPEPHGLPGKYFKTSKYIMIHRSWLFRSLLNYMNNIGSCQKK